MFSDLPMVEKTSADGASHHSDESDGSHEGSDVINKKSIHKRVSLISFISRLMTFQYKHYNY